MKSFISIILITLSFISYSQEKLIKVNGRNYTVYLKGFENRKSNTPAIILENGLGVGLHHWDLILDELSKIAPVFAYDRAGVDKSDKSYQMPTPKFVAENLKAILNTVKIPPPYILIGHSIGGVYVRGFAGLYPNEIQGLVFIDPADFTEKKDDWELLLSKVGVSEKRIDEMMHDRLFKPSPVDSVNFGPWSERQVLTTLRRTDFAELHDLPLPMVPIYFFIGGKFEVPKEQWSKDYNHPDFFEIRTNLNIERWKKFIYSSDKGGALIYLSKAGHFVHRDDAKAVVGNIRIMLESLKQ